MISGAHAILYSRDAEADRNFLRDVLKLTHVDVGHGWLIFGLPPSEVAVHPSEGEAHHELYLLCDDVQEFVKAMTAQGIACGPVENPRWGLITQVTLPGGGKLGVYQPLHPRPEPVLPRVAARRKPSASRKASRQPAKGKAAKPARRVTARSRRK